MPTFKAVILSQKRRKDNTFSVFIRLTHFGKVAYLPTFISVNDNQLTPKMQIKDPLVLEVTDSIIVKYKKQCTAIAEELPTFTCKDIAGKLIYSKQQKGFDFIEFGRKVANKLINKGYKGNAGTYLVALNALEKHLSISKLDIKDLTPELLEKFIAKLGDRKRAPSLYIANLKAIYNKAKKELRSNPELLPTHSPFDFIDVPQTPAEAPHPTTAEAIKAIYNLPDSDSWGQNRYNLAKDVFILSFCLVGMNAADLYSCTDLENGRITYNRQKTKNRRSDQAKISIKIEPEILALVEKWKDPSGKRVFKFYEMYSSTGTFNAALEKGIKQVQNEITKELKPDQVKKLIGNKDLTPYTARHTWASLARNKAGVDKYDVHLSLNHVDDDMRSTDHYVAKDWSVIDRANRKVLDYLDLLM